MGYVAVTWSEYRPALYIRVDTPYLTDFNCIFVAIFSPFQSMTLMLFWWRVLAM